MERNLGKQPVAFCEQGQQSSRKHRENLASSTPDQDEVFQERAQSWRKQNLSARLWLEKPPLSCICAHLGAQSSLCQGHFPPQGDPIPLTVT